MDSSVEQLEQLMANDNDIHDTTQEYDDLLVELAKLHLDEPLITPEDHEAFDLIDDFEQLMKELHDILKGNE